MPTATCQLHFGTLYFHRFFKITVGVQPLSRPATRALNPFYLRPLHRASAAFQLVSPAAKTSSSLPVFEMRHPDECVQSGTQLFSYVLTTVFQYPGFLHDLLYLTV